MSYADAVGIKLCRGLCGMVPLKYLYVIKKATFNSLPLFYKFKLLQSRAVCHKDQKVRGLLSDKNSYKAQVINSLFVLRAKNFSIEGH